MINDLNTLLTSKIIWLCIRKCVREITIIWIFLQQFSEKQFSVSVKLERLSVDKSLRFISIKFK